LIQINKRRSTGSPIDRSIGGESERRGDAGAVYRETRPCPAHWRGLEEGNAAETLANNFRQAINDFGKPGYAGPCPPRRDKPHRYHFQLSALSEPSLPAASSATCEEVVALAQPYVLEFVELIGLYRR
jgi:phosphatidylethanolamine-binding protein (PEBP) family uncharacterized protein